ncbi:MAG: hypothetical protein ACWGMZ_06590, partial [Thermoguttaceae bacterium]
KVFRKHQKVMLAVVTILAMFSFVFLGVISDLIGRSGTQNPVIVRTDKFGNLLSSDLHFMRQERFQLRTALTNMLVHTTRYDPSVCRQIVESRFGGTGDEDLVDTWLLAREAEALGIMISNETVNEFLQAFTGNKLGAQEISAIIRGAELSENIFFNVMREQLRANKFTQLFNQSISSFTPAQRWRYFCQLRRHSSVELIPVDVENFLAMAKAPKDETLKKYFEKYKDVLSRPDSPEPGFRSPHIVELQYFKAQVDKFAAADAVSEEEIQNYYKKNRDYVKQLESKADGALKSEKKTPPKKIENEKPAAGTQQPKEQTKQQPAEQNKATQPPVEPHKTGAPENSKKATSNKSSCIGRSAFRLTALTDQAATSASEAPDSSNAPAAEKSAGETQVEQKPSAKPSESSGKTDVKSEKSTPTSSAESAAKKTENATAELSQDIKEKIRFLIAGQKIHEIFFKLSEEMHENGKKWRKYEAQKIKKLDVSPPPRLDFAALAKKYGLSAAQTGLVSKWDLHSFDIGSSYISGSLPFVATVFKSMPTYRSEISFDAQGNEYLFWKIADMPEVVPSFEDKGVREKVLRAWKMPEARDLALKQAEQLAETARKKGGALKEAFAGHAEIKVLTPSPFTFYTEGSVPRASSRSLPSLSKVEDVPMAGRDFMKAVFNLNKGQIGIAMNQPKNVVYVIRLVDSTPLPKVLWEIFLVDDFSKYAPVAILELQQTRNKWLEDLKKSAGLKWEQKPRVDRSSSEEMPDD